MTTTVLLRLRRFVARHGLTLAVVLFVVGTAALGAAWWTVAHPPTTEITEHTHEQSIHSSLETRAVVSEPSQLYDFGTTLRNQPVYLQTATPVVTLTHRTAVPDGTSVAVDQRLALVIEATHEGEVFWQSNQTLAATATTTTSGEVTTRARLNITALEQRLADRRAAIEGAGALRTALRLRVHYDTGRYTDTFTKRAPLTLEDGWYTVPTPETTRTRRTPVERTTTVPQNALSYLLPGAGGLLALLGSVGVAGAWHYRLRDADPAELRQRIERQVHADWISAGCLDDVDADRHVQMESLEDVVELGVDMDERVIHDAGREVFAVLEDDTVYYYDGTDPMDWEWEGEPFGEAS